MKPINVGLLGIGTVGGGTATVLKRNAEEISRRAGRAIQLKMVADLNTERAREVAGEGVEVTNDAFNVVNSHGYCQRAGAEGHRIRQACSHC